MIKSFNYDADDGDSMSGGYPNDMDYTICIKKEPGFCSISYELAADMHGYLPYAVGSTSSSSSTSTSSSNECRDDYLIIGGTRLCSGRGPMANGLQVDKSDERDDGDGEENGELTLPDTGLLISANSSPVNLMRTGRRVNDSMAVATVGPRSTPSAAAAAAARASLVMTDTTSGPFFMRFVSNGKENARGFNFHYKQNPCK